MWVMKIVRTRRVTASMAAHPKWLKSWKYDPSPQSSSKEYSGVTSTYMLLTFRYLLGFMEPVPRNTIWGSTPFSSSSD